MQEYLLAFDVGTTSCKACLFDTELKLIASAVSGYETAHPYPGWAEHQCSDWLDAIIRNMKELLDVSQIDPKAVIAIGLDTLGSTLVPVDGEGNALGSGLIWMDRRSSRECSMIDSIIGDDLLRINGNHNDPSNIAPKILWMKANKPEIYKRTSSFLHANGYIAQFLTGLPSMDITEGGLTQLFDIQRGCWSRELTSDCGIDQEKLPEIVPCHRPLGRLTSRAAKLLGLPSGIPVMPGAMDMVSAALGSGVVSEGDTYVSAGTVTAVGVCRKTPIPHKDLHLYHHIIPDTWISAAGVDYGGAGFRWFQKLLEIRSFGEIDRMISEADRGSEPLIFLPYMVGQRAPLWNSQTRGVLLGLHPSTTEVELFRAFMEGNALGVRRILDIIGSTGVTPGMMKLTGGCSNSEPWIRIFADVSSLPITIPGEMDVASLGGAISAAIGVGLYPDFSSLPDLTRDLEVLEPDRSAVDLYHEYFRVFNRALDQMMPVYQELEDVRTLLQEKRENP